MSKILFLNGGAYSHVKPTIPLVKELIKLGEEVVYFSSKEYQDIIESTGSTFKAYNFIKFKKNIHKDSFSYLINVFNDCIDNLVPSVLELAKIEKFDYIIFDSVFGCGKQIQSLLELPGIAIFITTSAERDSNPFAKDKEPGLNKKMNISSSQIREYVDMNKKLKKKYNLSFGSPDNLFYNSGSLNIVLTSKYFQPKSDKIKNDYIFIGPIIENKKNYNDASSFVKRPGKKLIYISMGTIFSNEIDIFNFFIKTFSNFDAAILISTGNNDIVLENENIPEHIIIKRFVNQVEVLKEADVFISHGGINSVQESIYFNVPLIIIPQDADQYFMASRIIELGAGIFIDKNELTGERLLNSIDEVLTNKSFKVEINKIRQSFINSGGIKTAIDYIKMWKKKVFNNNEVFLNSR